MKSASRKPRRQRLLLIAYACSPYHGSEPGVGWKRATEAAREFDTWVICEGHEFKADLERYRAENGLIPGLQFCCVTKPLWERWLARLPGCYFLSYNLWHRRAFNKAKQLHQAIGFDLTHQSTMCGFREPGYLHALGLPHVWGPIGGTQNLPGKFLSFLGLKTVIQEGVRSIANWIQLRTSLRVRRAIRTAGTVLAANQEISDAIASVHGVRLPVLCDVGTESVVPAPKAIKDDEPIRILWSGNLKPFKALPLVLHALAQVTGKISFELRVLGEGPYRQKWQRLTRKLRLEKNVRFLGRIPHAVAIAEYQDADLFVFTSLRDTTGTVILEALSAGLPVVTLDHQGAADVINDSCGIRIPVSAPDVVINNLAQAILRLATHRELREELSRGAINRAHEYSWAENGKRMRSFYYAAIDAADRHPRREGSSECSAPTAADEPPACLSEAIGVGGQGK